ncbi:MAG: Cu(I)-responsive transcriptional regulator [Porticoccaceae bacterium]|nr:Cu(I)-responsive transcriptional regulator [Porticoccaceae bacterium]
MNISQTATETGLSAKTIRYYESIGLISQTRRKTNGYRDYEATDLKQLKFLCRARDFGFSIEDCRVLLSLYQNPERKSAEVHELVEKKLQDVDQRIRELQSMRSLLDKLISDCPNDTQPECAIIDSMAGREPLANINTGNLPAKLTGHEANG